MTDFIQNDGSCSRACFWRTLLLVFVFFVAISTAAAQDDDVVRIDTELVSFEVTATDKHGKAVPNLRKEDFRFLEDGVERPIEFFQPIKKTDQGRPLTVVFALDVSGSMTEPEIARLRSAMQIFISRLADYNSYFAVVSFAMEVRTLQTFTNQKERLERSFEKLVRDQGGLSTHAYDAVDDAIRLIERKSPKVIKGRLPKRAVI